MSGKKKVCRVCGKEYDACKSARTGNSVFNWREVACSPECGAKYLRQVEQARSGASAKKAPKVEKKVEKPVVVEEKPVEAAPVDVLINIEHPILKVDPVTAQVKDA